jgi:aminopeptidase N
MAKDEMPIMYEHGGKSSKYSSTIRVNKWVLIGGIVFFVLAAVAVGLGVYYGTRCQPEKPVTTAGPPTRTTTPTPDIRLPTNLSPVMYWLSVKTYIPSPSNVVTYTPAQNFTFEGNVTIEILCNDDAPTIVMQMSNINISEVHLKLVYPNETVEEYPLQSPQYSYDDDLQEVTFYPVNSLLSGSTYLLVINYTGQLAGDLRGFYRSNYVENGQMNWLAVTQFEPTDARRALPCFDEPSFKANFSVTIIHPNDMSAISNGAQTSSDVFEGNWNITTFLDTPKMSTYLLAMCVAAFDHVDRTSAKNVLFRVWARPSFINDAWYALEKGPEVLDYYANYFGIDFPLSKQDMVALPDFQAGAMENWGMVTYRERDLLVRNGTYAAANIQNTATVIAHELAHQWFGDLVTLDWWDDIWLNEGFATFMQYKGVNRITNFTMRQQQQFVPMEEDVALQLDELSSSHPLYDPSLVTPDQIFGAFDDIAYDKGSSVIHMLEQVVSEKILQQGLIYYLTAHEYGNAKHQDLWIAIQQAVNESGSPPGWVNGTLLDVNAFMNPWVEQTGYPVVNATRNYDDQTVTFKQQRFILPGNYSQSGFQNTSLTWYVPIWITPQNSPDRNNSFSCWLTPDPNFVQSPEKFSNDEWIIVNTGVNGYYRVNYDTTNWRSLQKQLTTNLSTIDPRNRAQLLDDALNLARAGQMDYDIALDTTLYLNNEMSYVPWLSVSSTFTYFNDMFALNVDYESFGKYLSTKMSPIYNALGFDGTSPFDNVLPYELRQYAVSVMCQLENSNCLQTALQQFATFKVTCNNKNGTSNCSPVNANVRKTVYCSGVGQGSVDDFNYMYMKYPEEQVAVERDNILYGLCCSKDPWALTKLLNQAIDPNSTFIRQQDAEYVFQYVSTNNVGREMLWDYFTTNWVQISSLFSGGFFSLGTIIQGATRSFNTPAQIQQMLDFLVENGNQLGTGTATYIQQLETAQANAVWMQQYAPQVVQWFKNNV